jgi:hypothetical protein
MTWRLSDATVAQAQIAEKRGQLLPKLQSREIGHVARRNKVGAASNEGSESELVATAVTKGATSKLAMQLGEHVEGVTKAMNNDAVHISQQSETVHCIRHGDKSKAYVCSHLLHGTGLGFFSDRDDIQTRIQMHGARPASVSERHTEAGTIIVRH